KDAAVVQPDRLHRGDEHRRALTWQNGQVVGQAPGLTGSDVVEEEIGLPGGRRLAGEDDLSAVRRPGPGTDHAALAADHRRRTAVDGDEGELGVDVVAVGDQGGNGPAVG